jgi:4-hydroxyacetophenone monooxygenase
MSAMRIDLQRAQSGEGAPPLTADDEAIASAVVVADVPALLTAVAHLTGELDLLQEELRPDPSRVLEPDAGLTPAQVAQARQLATEALVRYREAGCPPAPPPSEESLRRMIEFLVGPDSLDAYLRLLEEELALAGADLRAPRWHKSEVAPDRPFDVAVIGAGMSGLVVAHRLRQAGVSVTVLEKNPDVGGTWFENTYPGCRVDVPNHLYSYSFAQTGDWPEFFSSQEVLLDYFRACADELGVRAVVRFDTEVLDATFDDGRQVWQVRTCAGDGSEQTSEFHAVVSAVGQLNRPNFPDIPGRDRFAGPSFHSARWEHDVDLTQKRVGVIGTGASAAQFIPAVADDAAELLVFQRTPPWLVPSPEYHDALPDGLRWLMHHIPNYARWDRLWLFWRTHEGLLPMAKVDPDWDAQGRSVSAPNELVRQLLEAYLRAEFPDDELFAKVVPDYPPMAKRVIRDNGIWGRTLARDDVELITRAIDEITEKGIRTADGVEHEVDVVIYGTGFQASKFLTPMNVVGRGGVDLHEQWGGDARAYLGIMVPHFPNLFLMYGPNTNIVINGSIIYFSECETHYITESIRMLLETDKQTMDCRPEVHDAYNEKIDAANRQMAWGASEVNSWYKNEKGRVAQNWPFSLLQYWEQTRAPDPDDYDVR